MGGLRRGRGEPSHPAGFSRNAFSAPPHSAPLRAALPWATTARAAVSARPGTAEGKASLGPAGRPAAAVCTSGTRLPHGCRRADAKLCPSLPSAFFIPQLPGRLVSASANRYRPPHVLLLAASHPSPTPSGWGRARPQGRSRARRGALESQMPPPTKRSHPLRGSLARPDAANSSHLH